MTPRLPTPANRSLETADAEPLVLFRRPIRSGSLLRRGATMSAVEDSGGFKASKQYFLRISSFNLVFLQFSKDRSAVLLFRISRSVKILSKVLISFFLFADSNRSRVLVSSWSLITHFFTVYNRNRSVNAVLAVFDRDSWSRSGESLSAQLVDPSSMAVPGADPWKARAQCSLILNNSWSRSMDTNLRFVFSRPEQVVMSSSVTTMKSLRKRTFPSRTAGRFVVAISSPQRQTRKKKHQAPSQPKMDGDDDGSNALVAYITKKVLKLVFMELMERVRDANVSGVSEVTEEFSDIDWSDLIESELEELILSNLKSSLTAVVVKYIFNMQFKYSLERVEDTFVEESTEVVGSSDGKTFANLFEEFVDKLNDIAILTGGTVIREDVGLSLDKADTDVLSHAAKVVVIKDSATIVGDGRTQEKVSKRAAQIKNLIEVAEQDYEKEKLNERVAKLSGSVAVIQVGAQTETELKEKKLRMEDSLNATKVDAEKGSVVEGQLKI